MKKSIRPLIVPKHYSKMFSHFSILTKSLWL